MSVFERIMKEIHSGMVLYTPVDRHSFKIFFDKEKVVFFVGAKTRIKIPRACWDGIPDFLSGKGWVNIGARHNVAPRGSFEEYLDTCEGKSHASGASYVVPVLEYLKIVEVDHNRPSKVKLK
jgi:hypothetical protein